MSFTSFVQGGRLLSIAWKIITHHGMVSQRWHLGMTRWIPICHGHPMDDWWDMREQHIVHVWWKWWKWMRPWNRKPCWGQHARLVRGYGSLGHGWWISWAASQIRHEWVENCRWLWMRDHARWRWHGCGNTIVWGKSTLIHSLCEKEYWVSDLTTNPPITGPGLVGFRDLVSLIQM